MNTPNAFVLAAEAVNIPEQTETQYWIALAAVLLVFAGSLIYWYYSQYAGLEEHRRQHKAAVIRSKHSQSPLTLRIPASADASEYSDRLRDLCRNALAGELSVDPDHVSVRAALGELRDAIDDQAGDRLPSIPRVSVLGLQTGIAVFVTGALAVATDTIVRLLGYETGGVGGGTLLDSAVDLTVTVFSSGETAISWFPYSEVLWSLFLTVWILGTQWLYQHWLSLSLVLIMGALAVAMLDYEIGTPDSLYPSAWGLSAHTAAVLFHVWFVGILFGGLGALAGLPTLGAAVGFLAAFTAAVYFSYKGFRGFIRRVRTWSVHHDGQRSLTATYLLIRPLLISAVAVALPMILIYLGVIILHGKLGRVVGAYLSASLEVQLAGLAILAAAVAGTLYVGRDAWPDLRSALLEAGSRRRVKAAVLGRGVPYAAVAVGYIATYSLTRSIVIAAILGALAGVTAYLLYSGLRSAQERTEWLWDAPDPPTSVLVEVFSPVDADDDRHLLVRLDGRVELAYDNIDDAVEDLPDQINAVSDRRRGEAAASAAAWYARDLQQHGIVDEADSRERVRELVREEALRVLRDGDRMVSTEELRSSIEEYPDSLWAEWRQEWLRNSIIRVDGDYIVLRNDPYAAT